MNPFKNLFKNQTEIKKTVEHKNYVPENFEGISDAEFDHVVGMFTPGENSILTDAGRGEFLNSVKSVIERGEKTKEEILEDMRDLPAEEFYIKYNS